MEPKGGLEPSKQLDYKSSVLPIELLRHFHRFIYSANGENTQEVVRTSSSR